jgi:hypothetical protein
LFEKVESFFVTSWKEETIDKSSTTVVGIVRKSLFRQFHHLITGKSADVPEGKGLTELGEIVVCLSRRKTRNFKPLIALKYNYFPFRNL